jgi:hypothetical protein
VIPSWRAEGVKRVDACLHCGRHIGEGYRLTNADRRLNSGVWLHVDTKARPCDPEVPKGSKAYPDRRVQE